MTLRSASPFLAVVLAALAARVAWVAYAHPVAGLADDAGYYDFFARSILRGDGYVRPEGTPTAFWPVGYPAALAGVYAVFGESVAAAKAFNAVLGALTAGLVFLLARRWFGVWQSLAAGLVYAFFPGAIGFTSVTMSEPLFTLLFMAALYVAVRSSEVRPGVRGALVFGVLAAGAAYVRGQALALPLFAAAILLVAGRRPREAASYAALSLAVVAALSVPWLIRNTLAFGEVTFMSTNTGINFWLGHNPEAKGGPDYHLQLWFAGQYNYLPLVEREPAWNREGLRQGLRYMLSHPAEEMGLSLRKVVRLYENDSDAIAWNEQNGGALIFQDDEREKVRLIFDGYYYVAGAAALAGVAVGFRARERWAAAAAGVLVLWTLIHVLFYGEPRLHVPVLPVLSILATVPVARLLGRRARAQAAAHMVQARSAGLGNDLT